MMFALLLLAAVLSPLERAVAYLTAEVPRWRAENGCFSCHNNGDGARALYQAGVPPTSAALRETTAWLGNPPLWDSNRGDPAVSDKKLARIQFGAALLASGAKEPICAAASVIRWSALIPGQPGSVRAMRRMVATSRSSISCNRPAVSFDRPAT